MFENPRTGRQTRSFRTDIFRKLTLGAPDLFTNLFNGISWSHINKKVSLKFFFFAYPSDAIYAEILFSS